jgi:hypothetical protein
MSINSVTDRIISDWRDLLSELETGRVRFLVIGGYAVMKYTEPYNTKDLDLWIDPAPDNAGRLYEVLTRFGAPLKGITAPPAVPSTGVQRCGLEPLPTGGGALMVGGCPRAARVLLDDSSIP